MPPSGFSSSSADGLVTFLREAMADLLAEVSTGKHASLEVGLAYEITQIKKALSGNDGGEQERALLVLTKTFYAEVLVSGKEAALASAHSRVLAVHVNEQGRLTKK